MAILKVKRGTRAQINAAVTGNLLIQGEPFLITDEGRIGIGTGSNTFEAFAKQSEVAGVLDGDLTAIAALTGTGFAKRTGTDTWVLDTNTYLTAESDTLSTVTGRGASTSTAVTFSGGATIGGVGVTYNGSTSGSTILKAAATAGATTITMPSATGTMALTSDIPTVNNSTLTLSIGTAAATNNTVTVATGTGFSTNVATNQTYQLSVGPALTALAALMTGAGSGFVKKTAADTYAIDTATYLTANQSITLSGDASGTGTTAITVTLPTVNSNVGTFTKVTVNAKGLVTAATTLLAADIPTLTASKISDFDTQVRTSTVAQLAAPAAALAMNSQKITGLADPTAAQDAATKAYVDSVAQGLDAKASVRAATTANITLSGTQTIDGVAVVANDRVLVKNQTTTSENGIWVAAAGAWARATDADIWNELISAFTFVEEGTTNADTGWVCTVNAGGTIGSTAVAWSQFSSAGSYIGGAGLVLTGSTFDVVGTTNRITVNADSIDIAATYVGQTSITTLGTVATGTWSATTIAETKGGTNQTTYATGDLLYASAANTLSKLTKPATNTSFLQMTSAGAPSWTDTLDGGVF